MRQLMREQRPRISHRGHHGGHNVLRDRAPRGGGGKLPGRQPVGQQCHNDQHAPVHADPDAADPAQAEGALRAFLPPVVD
jgi:hypothetical protein